MKHVVALSGGKDSCAMSLRLAEVEPREYEYVITPTGNELPEMQQHWNRMAALLGKPLTVLKPFDGDGLAAVIRQEGMIPNFRARFCTRILKIEPMQVWLAANAPAVQYVGLRADEEHREGMYGVAPGITQRYPLREWGWGIDDVWNYLDERGVTIPERTDCALCFFQRLPEWKRLRKRHPESYAAGERIEAEMGHTFRSKSRDSWPAGLTELRAAFDSGRAVRGYSEDRQLRFPDCDREALCRVCSM